MEELGCTRDALRSGRSRFTFRSCRTCCTLIALIPFVALVTLHLRPRISRKRIAVCRREVGVLSDVCARSLTTVCRERRTIIRVFDMQIGSLTVRSGWSGDTLISFHTLRSFQLHPLVWGVPGWSGRACCHRSTDISVRRIAHRITVRVSGVLHMEELGCTRDTLRSGRSRFTFRTCRTCCTLVAFIPFVALRNMLKPICGGFTWFLIGFIFNTYICTSVMCYFVIIEICSRFPFPFECRYGHFCNPILRKLFDGSSHVDIT